MRRLWTALPIAALTAATLMSQPLSARADVAKPQAVTIDPVAKAPTSPWRPGDLISSEPMTAYLLPGIPLSARAWRVVYKSTTATGGHTTDSGTVLVPKKAWTGTGPRPLIGYAIGTQGLADRCAASRQLAAGTEYETTLITQALNHGWAVALTDYPGLDTPNQHTYVVGRALGRSVLDSMRAALRLEPAGLDPHAPLGIYGFSEGGEAAGWAIGLQPSYAPDLKLAGGAVGGAPADFFREFDYVDNTPRAFLIMWTAIGFNAAYPELDMDKYLTSAGRKFRDQTETTCLVTGSNGTFLDGPLSAILTAGTSSAKWFTTTEFSKLPGWEARFTQNNLVNAAPRAPVILGAGRGDEVMAYDTSGPGLYKSWCAQGSNVKFYDVPFSIKGLDLIAGQHLAGAFQFAPAAFNFLADRFAGTQLSRASDCRRS